MSFASGNRVFIIFAASILISVFAYNKLTLYLARQKFKKENGCKPPPKASIVVYRDKIFGTDLMRENMTFAKERTLLENGQKRFAKYGNTFHARIFNMPIVATCEPQNIKTVLSLKFKDFSLGNREKAFGPLLGKGIFNTDGERWHHSRQMIRPNFARDQVADIGAFERHIQVLFRIIPHNGETIDIQELFFRFTIDSATEFLFGSSINSLSNIGNDSGAEFARAFNETQEEAAKRTRMGALQALRGMSKEMKASHDIVHAFVDQYVDQAIEYRKTHDPEKNPKEEKYVFLHELAKQTSDKKRLRDELLNVLLAGRDTTASLLSNMFWQLARRPGVWSKLQAEVAELNGNPPTYEQLRNMKYLKYCLNESLRINPVVPGNSRYCIRDTALPLGGGKDGKSPLFVPKGSLVLYSPWTMHRRKDFYGEDADEFKPERWETLRPGWEYLPFNGGPRICLGQQYALTEAGYVTTRIVQEFGTIEPRDSEPWREGLTLTLCTYGGVKIGLKGRE